MFTGSRHTQASLLPSGKRYGMIVDRLDIYGDVDLRFVQPVGTDQLVRPARTETLNAPGRRSPSMTHHQFRRPGCPHQAARPTGATPLEDTSDGNCRPTARASR